ncbi:hypothetical protein Mapa_007997 [Marchantia paleacea]|nr:hypothetical protein Mapa_007997 [Marchantia paleacea]
MSWRNLVRAFARSFSLQLMLLPLVCPESMGLDDSDLPRTHEGKNKARTSREVRIQFASWERCALKVS